MGTARAPGELEPLLVEVLDSLEAGLLVVDLAIELLSFANRAGRDFLAELAPDEPLPARLRSALRAGATAVGRWSPPVPLVAPSGRGHLVRAMLLHGNPARLLVRVDPVRRPARLADLLRRRFELSHREIELVEILFAGASNDEIARRTGLTVSTVKTYLNRVFAATGVKNRIELLVLLRALERPPDTDDPAADRAAEKIPPILSTRG